MITYLDCMPCFLKQAIKCSELLNLSAEKTKAVVDKVALTIPHLSMEQSPPFNSRSIYDAIQSITGIDDPFLAIKKESNDQALQLYPTAKKIVQNSPDPLLMSIHMAAAGNVIDYGTTQTISSIITAFQNALKQPFSVFCFESFKEKLNHANNILFLGDNAGEIVFDRLLIETIGKPVTYAVRGFPIINDALKQDAIDVGIDQLANLIDNGAGYPGTVLDKCSDTFKKAFDQADLIISKGQGNFETLSDVNGPICMIFMVKCHQVIRHVQSLYKPEPPVQQGQFVLGCSSG
jgi:hypothetical protein